MYATQLHSLYQCCINYMVSFKLNKAVVYRLQVIDGKAKKNKTCLKTFLLRRSILTFINAEHSVNLRVMHQKNCGMYAGNFFICIYIYTLKLLCSAQVTSSVEAEPVVQRQRPSVLAPNTIRQT